MRDILFRGKTKNGEWKIGDLIIEWYGETPYIHWFEYSSLALSREEKVTPETVGQFTGLTDKNGKKIFEGDIIKANHNFYPYTVFVRECKVCIEDKYGNAIRPTAEALKHFDSEVIGNIHDNPELLESE